MIHALKTATKYFEESAAGIKSFEIRRNDRPYSLGDYVALNEWTIEGYTGRCALYKIIYILNNKEFCKEGYITLGLKPCEIRSQGELMAPIRHESGAPIYERQQI